MTFDHQIRISSGTSPTEHLYQILRNPFKLFLRYRVQKNGMDERSKKQYHIFIVCSAFCKVTLHLPVSIFTHTFTVTHTYLLAWLWHGQGPRRVRPQQRWRPGLGWCTSPRWWGSGWWWSRCPGRYESATHSWAGKGPWCSTRDSLSPMPKSESERKSFRLKGSRILDSALRSNVKVIGDWIVLSDRPSNLTDLHAR